jgi:hypothetical protein
MSLQITVDNLAKLYLDLNGDAPFSIFDGMSDFFTMDGIMLLLFMLVRSL